MRGKRGEDLIWNGSAEVSRAGRASVKVVLDNKNNLFSAVSKATEGGDFEEAVIERVVNRDGTNEYYLNGSLVRLKDIIELLANAHIGASGHHIISQGEADRILSANMKERKEMVEDALGLKIYQYKREESERKLAKTEENIKQVESLRREIAPHIRFLKKQVEKVEKAEELKNKLSKFYREYLKREKIYLDTQKNQLAKEKNPVIERLVQLEKEMEEAKRILANSAKKDEKSEELIAIENKIKNERDSRDKLYRDIGRIEGEINANRRNIERIEAEQRSEETKTIPLREVEELEKEISQYSEVTKIIQKIRDFIIKHKTNFNSKNLNEIIENNQNLENKKIEIEESIKIIDNTLTNFTAEYQQIKDSIEREKDSSREAEKNIFKISGEQSETRSKLELLKEKEYRLNLEENDWKLQIQEGGVLLGTAILGFENETLTEENQSENFSSNNFTNLEPREKQEERKKNLKG